MTMPKIIIFDYGHTLLAEPGWNGLRGQTALMRHAVKNSRNLSAEEVNEFAEDIFRSICGQVRDMGMEFHQHQFQNLVYEYLQIEFDLSPEEMELCYWDNAAPGEKMPHIEEVLAYLHDNGIRSGVISNLGFSGNALKIRIDRLLSEHHFEFIIASSEYMLRKPTPILFELALRKAGLPPADVWYCGDNPTADVEGASGVGIFPVWYDDLTMENPFWEKNHREPDCAHLHIRDWREMIAALEARKL